MKTLVLLVLRMGLVLLAWGVAVAPLSAASAQASTAWGVVFVHPGTPAGACDAQPGRDGDHEIACVDGGNSATYRAGEGCATSSGSGYCGVGVEWRPGLGGAQLNCPHGVSYWLFSGVATDNGCRSSGGTKSCETTDHAGYARATCAMGCENTALGGNCCQVGMPGCPPFGSEGTPTGEEIRFLEFLQGDGRA